MRFGRQNPRKQRIKPGKFTKNIGRETVPYMRWKDHTPLTVVPQNRKSTSRRRPNMNAKILTFSSHGDTTLLEYDPATADLDEVNRVIAEYEAKTGAQPFDMATGERLEKVTREQNEVLMVHPIAGG